MMICKEIDEYIAYVRSGEYRVCEEQLLLCDFVEKVFREEEIYVDEEQLHRYLNLQKYFPYELLPWEKFCFALHNCTYRSDGQLRFPHLFIMVGRGAGKNGYLAFEDFALITPVNGVKNYNIDMFATSEDQAKATFKDIYEILESNKIYFKNYFKWNLEEITNLRTRSTLKYHTKAPGTKDGGRPGKVDFDEYHAYQDYKLINVVTTGLGKVAHPRKTIITTNGDVRDGPLDAKLNEKLDVLHGRRNDNGELPFICRLGENAEEQVKDKKNWYMANPSLQYFPTLLHEMELEYEDYKSDPVNNSAFLTKRMNRPKMETESSVTAWENLVAATCEIDETKLQGHSCVVGIDFSMSSDFTAAGLLFKDGDKRFWIHHTWVCEQSLDLPRIKFPLKQAEEDGVLTFVKDTEIDPRLITNWLAEQAKRFAIEMIVIDNFRYSLMKDALKDIGFTPEKGNVKLIRPSDLMKVAVTIGFIFSKKLLTWGTSTIMRWYTWNVKAEINDKGNVEYKKIEPKSRKTDGFMAFAAAMTQEDKIKARVKIGGRLRTIC